MGTENLGHVETRITQRVSPSRRFSTLHAKTILRVQGAFESFDQREFSAGSTISTENFIAATLIFLTLSLFDIRLQYNPTIKIRQDTFPLPPDFVYFYFPFIGSFQRRVGGGEDTFYYDFR